MKYFHNPDDPRHKRLFEFLRQEETAERIMNDPKAFRIRRTNPDELETIKRVAARSMMQIS